jgi:hypothetical protein
MTAADRLLRDVAIAEAAELLGIAEQTALIRAVLINQEAQMSTFDDLRRAITENTAVDNQLVQKFEEVRAKVDQLPVGEVLTEEHQRDLDEAVAALETQTAAALGALNTPGGAVSPDTGAAPSGTVPAGSTVTIPVPSDPGPNPSLQGGTINVDDEHPTPTGGVSPVLVDPGSSTAVSTADAPPAGTAADVAAQEQQDAGDGGQGTTEVTEPAPATETPISESPADPTNPADASATTVDNPEDAQPQPTDAQPTVTAADEPARPNWDNTPADLGPANNTSDLPADADADNR